MPVTLNLITQGNKALIVTAAERENMEGGEIMKAYHEELDLIDRVDRVIGRIDTHDGQLYVHGGEALPQDMADYIVKNLPYVIDGSSTVIQALHFLYDRKKELSHIINEDTVPYHELEISDDAIIAILSMVFGKQNPSDTSEPEPMDLGGTIYRTLIPEDEDEEA